MSETTQIELDPGEFIHQCNNCGAHASTIDTIQHFSSCIVSTVMDHSNVL